MKKLILGIISLLVVVVLLTIGGCNTSTTITTATATTTNTTAMTTTTSTNITTETTTTQNSVSILPAPPVVSLVDPYGGTGYPVNASITATFYEPMDPSTINTNTFILMQGTTPVTGTVSYFGNTALLDPANDLTKDTEYTASITTGVTDLNGIHMQSDFTWTFTTGELDTVPPIVVATVPSSMPIVADPNNPFGVNTLVPINNAISATFGEGMDPSTINANTFTLMQGTTPVAGKVTFDGDRTATLTPANSLLPNTDYTATITTGATCLGGNTLAQNFVWSFTTGPAQTTVPEVVSTVPANSDTNVPINDSVTAIFSEGINPMTINAGTFTLWQGTTPIPGTVTFDGVHTAVFDPLQDLTINTSYTAMISTGVTDLAGIPMASNYSWSFMTGATDTTVPMVISTNPADGDKNVPTNTTITVKFSEAIDPTNFVSFNGTPDFALQQGTTYVPCAITFDNTLTMVTFTPEAPLTANTTYTIMVTGVTDMAGNGPASKTWSFTTAP